STLHPLLTLLDATNEPVSDTPGHTMNCAVPNACASSCPVFRRTLPFDGVFRLAVQGVVDGACTGGKYKLVLVSPGGAVPPLVADAVAPGPCPARAPPGASGALGVAARRRGRSCPPIPATARADPGCAPADRRATPRRRAGSARRPSPPPSSRR